MQREKLVPCNRSMAREIKGVMDLDAKNGSFALASRSRMGLVRGTGDGGAAEG